VKRIVILDRHNRRSDDLKALLKKLFPECEICNAFVIDKEGKPAEYVTHTRAEPGDEKDTGGSF